MTKKLAGKVALVTGSGRGVGRGIALALAKAGASVVINDLGASLNGKTHTEQPAIDVLAEIEAMGGHAIIDGGSVAIRKDADAMIEAAVNAFGRLDIVVNNAGILRDGIFHRMTEQDFDDVIAVHLKGAFNVSRAAAPLFKEQAGGCYVHMTSTSGLIGNFGQANYAAAKLGIMALSKSIAIDMQKFNVRSNAIAPFAWTRMIDSIPAETPEQLKRMEGLKKLDPEKVAPFVTALCCDEAVHVTGQVFAVRNNELHLFSQPRPVRSLVRDSGWTVDGILETAFPMMQSAFYPLDRSGDVFHWDPV